MKPTNKQILKAFDESIESWRDRAKGGEGADKCPLCEARGLGCSGCPLYAEGRWLVCEEPFKEWRRTGETRLAKLILSRIKKARIKWAKRVGMVLSRTKGGK